MNTQPDWMREYTQNLEAGNAFVLILEGEHFAVVKSPGSTFASVQSRLYGKTQYILVEKGKGYWEHKDKDVWTGRLTKEGKTAIKAALDAAEKGIVT